MKRRIIILGTVVLAVLVLWSAAWFFAAGQITGAVAGLATVDGTTNPRLTCADSNVSGFPFRFDVTCRGAVLTQADVSAEIAELRATIRVYQPFHVLVFAQGPANLSDAFTGTRSRIDWERLEASVRLSDWRIARGSLLADKVAWTDTLVGETAIAAAEHLELHLLDMPERLDVAAHTAALAAYATLTGVAAPRLQVQDGEATLEAEISGLPDDVRALALPDALQRWQAAGGQLNLVSLRGNDPDQSFDVTGQLSLDPQGRAQGQLNLKSKGVVEHLQPLVPEQLRGLVLGSPAEDGTYNQALTLAGGVILSGIIPVGMLPPLW